MDNYELRMYGLVPYNLSPIQQGIQFSHALQRYNNNLNNLCVTDVSNFYYWSTQHETVILLNGGTTNSNPDKPGTLNQHLKTLYENEITFSTFHEPDLGDQLTAVLFLVDERVFSKKYLNFEEYLIEYYLDNIKDTYTSIIDLSERIKNSNEKEDTKIYNKWVKYIGGEKNAFLKYFISNFRLA
jgi:hypothetical protein